VSQIAERPIEAPPVVVQRRPDEPLRVDPTPAQPSRWAGVRQWARCHPDLAVLGPILIVGLVLRLALIYRIPPLFMPGDSQSFLTPAYDLARGLGFDPILKRPLGYPLVLAGVISFLGEDLRGLVFIQAMLGLVTVTATYWLGRLAFGRVAGGIAALSVAMGGQLLIYEHYILAESIFSMLLTLGLLALVASVRCPARARRLAVAGGASLALASLFRPISEVVIPLLPVYFLLAVRPSRRAWLLTMLGVVGFLAVMGPALLTDLVLRGGVSSGALGEHLLWRITRSDSGYITRADLPPGDAASSQSDPRRYVIRKAIDRTLPQEIFTGLRRDLGLSAGEADSVMRGVALEAILRQPGRYLTSTLRMWGELFFGEDQRLGEVSKKDGEAGYINPQARQRTWFEDRILHLGEPPSVAVENEFDRAERLTSIYQPGRFAWLLLIGAVVAGLVSLVSSQFRAGLIVALAVPPLLLADAALAGPEARFRYPVDPLIAVLAFGGLAWLVARAIDRSRRRRSA
jgi:hypothetical protein